MTTRASSSTAIENVLIGPIRRSGGTLVRRLLEGHPECSVFPFEYQYMAKKAAFDWRGNLFFRWRSPDEKLQICGFKDRFYRRMFFLHGDRDHDAFRDELRELVAGTARVRDFYQPSAALYFRFFHGSSLRSKLVAHCAQLSTLSPWQLRHSFGEHRLILPVRDPRAAYFSFETGRKRPYSEQTLLAFCRDWERSVEHHYLGDPSVISFRFEDLVRDPERVMRSVCTALGLAFDQALLQPTRLGQPVNANSNFPRSPGVDASAADSWKAGLGERQRRLIEKQLGQLMRRLAYL